MLTRVIPVLRGSGDVVGDDAVARLRQDLLETQAGHDPSPPRRIARSYDVRRYEHEGLVVHDLTPKGATPSRSVVYVHGGGFVTGIGPFHWRYAARLATALGVRVVLPSYPLTPTYTWRDATPPLVDLFEQVAIESPQGTALMGDSSGGGLALLVAQHLVRRGGPQPTHLVLFAPWVDLTGTTPGTEEADRADPWLNLTKLKVYGAWWGGAEPPEPQASPLANDLAGLPPALLFCGTRDLLWPQSQALVRRAPEAGWDLTYVEGPGLMHVYPVLPIPEAGPAFDRVEAFL